MRASTRFEYPKLVGHVEKALNSLGYPFLRNQTDRLTEFEVLSPGSFRVVVENNTREEYSFGFMRSVKTESSVELRRDLGAPGLDPLARSHAEAFIERLTSTMPESPWKGLGLVRSRIERANWIELPEI